MGRRSSVCKEKNASGNVQRLRAFIRAPSEHLPAKKFDFADRVAGCLHATMSACTPYMYTSYIIVYASTFRSIMLLLCYDVLRCPSKCTSCTYYIVVFYTFPPVHAPSPTPTANYIRHRPSTLQRQSAAHRRKLWSNKAQQNGWSRFTDNQCLDGPVLLLHSNHSRWVFNKFRRPIGYRGPPIGSTAEKKGDATYSRPRHRSIPPSCLSTCLSTVSGGNSTNSSHNKRTARAYVSAAVRIYRGLKSGIFFSMYFRWPVYTHAIEISEWKKSNPGITAYLYLSVTRPRRMMAYLFHTPNVDPSRTGGASGNVNRNILKRCLHGNN